MLKVQTSSFITRGSLRISCWCRTAREKKDSLGCAERGQFRETLGGVRCICFTLESLEGGRGSEGGMLVGKCVPVPRLDLALSCGGDSLVGQPV